MTVTVFDALGFAGTAVDLDVGTHQLAAGTAASSVRVPAGLVAQLFEHGDGTGGFGRSVDLLEDQADLAALGLPDGATYVDVFAAEREIDGQDHATGGTVSVPVAWVRGALTGAQYVAGHWERARATPPAPGPAVAAPWPLPHLLGMTTVAGADWVNPPFDTTSPTWASDLVGGATFDADAHPFEWVSVLDPTVEQDDQVGVTGFAVGVDLSGADLPFTHPFGGDFEFGIVPDDVYAGLLATSNRDDHSHNDNIAAAFPEGPGYGLRPAGAIPLEVEAGLVPEAFRVAGGDRVAAYGRWIVDAGHDDFHSEIHPPLLLARARPVDRQGAPGYPDRRSATHVQLWSRPYQAAQLFTDGSDHGLTLRTYLTDIAETVHDIRAYPPVFPTPFTGVHLVTLTMRPPLRFPAGTDPAALPALECSYGLTTNGSCGVQVQQSATEPGAVEIILALNAAGYPTLPEPPSSLTKYRIDDLVKEIPIELGAVTKVLVDAVEAYQSDGGFGEADLFVRTFAPLNAPDPAAVVPFTALADLPRDSVTVDDTQPFPVVGWLELRWALPHRVVFDPGHGLGGVIHEGSTLGPTLG